MTNQPLGKIHVRITHQGQVKHGTMEVVKHDAGCIALVEGDTEMTFTFQTLEDIVYGRKEEGYDVI